LRVYTPYISTYEHSKLANPTFPSHRRTITGSPLSQSPAVRGSSRTFSTYNVRARMCLSPTAAHRGTRPLVETFFRQTGSNLTRRTNKQCTSSMCVLLMKDKLVGGLPHFSEHASDDELSQTSSRMTTRQPCLKIWPSLLSRRTRSHWLTCSRCTVS
jgi:hypothetical protein